MTKETIISTANEILSEEFEVDIDTLVPDALLKETLGLDSLDLVDVVVLVEQHFGVTLTAQDFVDIKTLSDFYELIYNKQSQK